MSSDEKLLTKIIKAIKKVKLDCILIGNTAVALFGVPVMTKDIDFFVRDTLLNKKKIRHFAKLIGSTATISDEALTDMIKVSGKEIDVDFMFSIGKSLKYESVKSRAKEMNIGDVSLKIASIEDIVASKTSANRTKDKLTLSIIEDTLKIKKKINNKADV